jgi:hypothetical protein
MKELPFCGAVLYSMYFDVSEERGKKLVVATRCQPLIPPNVLLYAVPAKFTRV